MTPRERAIELCRAYTKKWGGLPTFGSVELTAAITSAIEAAVQEEREACAKLVDYEASGKLGHITYGEHIGETLTRKQVLEVFNELHPGLLQHVAAAIRTRGKGEPTASQETKSNGL